MEKKELDKLIKKINFEQIRGTNEISAFENINLYRLVKEDASQKENKCIENGNMYNNQKSKQFNR